jgi:hypothetical protein
MRPATVCLEIQDLRIFRKDDRIAQREVCCRKFDGDRAMRMRTVEEDAQALTEGPVISRALIEAPPLPLGEACTVTLDELLSDNP